MLAKKCKKIIFYVFFKSPSPSPAGVNQTKIFLGTVIYRACPYFLKINPNVMKSKNKFSTNTFLHETKTLKLFHQIVVFLINVRKSLNKKL